MATARKRRLTEQGTDEISDNSEFDLSSEDELLMGLDCISIDSDNADLSEERKWYSGAFTPSIFRFIGETGLQNTISFVEKTPTDYFQLFFDETNRYYS